MTVCVRLCCVRVCVSRRVTEGKGAIEFSYRFVFVCC